MTHARIHPDHDALAASLRSWTLALVAWLLEALGAMTLTRSMRGWVHAQLARAEKGAAALIVFAAMRCVPPHLPLTCGGSARPFAARQGFAHVPIHYHDMRGVLRTLFPRERCIARRSVRLLRVLHAIGTSARRIARRIARVMPATRLALVRPPALDFPAWLCAAAPAAADTS